MKSVATETADEKRDDRHLRVRSAARLDGNRLHAAGAHSSRRPGRRSRRRARHQRRERAGVHAGHRALGERDRAGAVDAGSGRAAAISIQTSTPASTWPSRANGPASSGDR